MLNKLTQAGLAKKIKHAGYRVSAEKIGRIERDQRDPSIREIQSLCDALNMSADWWLREKKASADVLKKRIDELTQDQRSFVLCAIDLAKLR